ncbi:Roadblock/LC7 family protein [Methanocaldococcus villosus KIN24-T80]|uniref:Roadblock/LC7 family protein n=1 Tax=Methanocaldococcus villosus KIN24-T80 TaxID=1069083 RepID=N6VZ02_9EURY|nr:hypothetical protein [Methanocaldococcus villosus]ENN96357.1 Roadblock/LC7 family protein [Methanocaldococcus villosus KIN24-T80]
MLSTIVFLLSFCIGTVLGIYVKIKREKNIEKNHKELENKVIENLKELKKYVAPLDDREYSKEYDLVEIALDYGLEDIVVVNDEGLVIASTLKDGEMLGASGLDIYERIKKYHDDTKKVIIYKDNLYTYIYRGKLNNERIYIIIDSKTQIDKFNEIEILGKIAKILRKQYMAPLENIESISGEIIKV